jgi:urocanate hydratase
MGKSIHAGAQVVADGTEDAAFRLERVLTNDPAMGILRHADAGYDVARAVARDKGVRIPMG